MGALKKADKVAVRRLTHLDAVEVVLQAAQKPLSARELAQSIQDGQIAPISGQTPWKTVTARLSQDILEHGPESRFMRTFHGRFSLRHWRFEPEFDPPRRALYPLDETIKVVPKQRFRSIVNEMASGAKDPHDFSYFLRASVDMARRAAEETTEVVQIIPTFVVERDDCLLTYRRTKRLPEARLHHATCVNFGGHMQADDTPALFMDHTKVVESFMLRELYEELSFSDPPADIRPMGVIYLQGSDFERQHVGLCFHVKLAQETEVESLEPGMHTDLHFTKRSSLKSDSSSFDSWSKTLIDAL